MLKLTTIAAIGLVAGLYSTAGIAATSTSSNGQTTLTIPSPINMTLDRGAMFADWRGGRMDRMRRGGRGPAAGGGRRPGGGPGVRPGRPGPGPGARPGPRARDARWRGDRKKYYRGGRYYRDRYYNNWGWVVPAAAVTAATIAATSSNRGDSSYACQAKYGRYYYQGRYRPGGPCYINVNGRTIGVSNYRAY